MYKIYKLLLDLGNRIIQFIQPLMNLFGKENQNQKDSFSYDQKDSFSYDVQYIKKHSHITMEGIENAQNGLILYKNSFSDIVISPYELKVMNYNIAQLIANTSQSYAYMKIVYFFRNDILSIYFQMNKIALMNTMRYMDNETMNHTYNSLFHKSYLHPKMNYKVQLVIIFDSIMIKSYKSIVLNLYDNSPLIECIYDALEESNEKYGVVMKSIKEIQINIYTPRFNKINNDSD